MEGKQVVGYLYRGNAYCLECFNNLSTDNNFKMINYTDDYGTDGLCCGGCKAIVKPRLEMGN